jgi:hypothetical protein
MASTSRIPTVFISSTAEDLQQYRAAARDGCGKARFFPEMQEYWVGREMYGSGRRIGMTKAKAESLAGARGTTLRGSCGRRSASGSDLSTGTMTSGFVAPGTFLSIESFSFSLSRRAAPGESFWKNPSGIK